MRDISEQFYELVLHHRSAGPYPGLSHSPARPGPGSHAASFAVTANHIAEEILRVNEAVRRDNQHFLRHMCCGVEVDDQPLQETEQLLSGAAHHVEQLQAIIDTAAAGGDLNPQELAHLHTIVAGLYEMLQECSGPFSVLQATHRSLTKQAAAFRKGVAARPITAGTAGLPDTQDMPPSAGLRRQSGDPPRRVSTPAATSHLNPPEVDEPQLSESEELMLQQENRALQSHLNDLAADILEVEATAQSLSALAALFASKVEEQNGQIEAIHRSAQESTDFVRQAARHITQATKHGVSFRFLILLALTGGSVVLLMLHAIIP
eukprot:EG_transcript_15049